MSGIKKKIPQEGTGLPEVGESLGAASAASCPAYSGGGKSRSVDSTPRNNGPSQGQTTTLACYSDSDDIRPTFDSDFDRVEPQEDEVSDSEEEPSLAEGCLKDLSLEELRAVVEKSIWTIRDVALRSGLQSPLGRTLKESADVFTDITDALFETRKRSQGKELALLTAENCRLRREVDRRQAEVRTLRSNLAVLKELKELSAAKCSQLPPTVPAPKPLNIEELFITDAMAKKNDPVLVHRFSLPTSLAAFPSTSAQSGTTVVPASDSEEDSCLEDLSSEQLRVLADQYLETIWHEVQRPGLPRSISRKLEESAAVITEVTEAVFEETERSEEEEVKLVNDAVCRLDREMDSVKSLVQAYSNFAPKEEFSGATKIYQQPLQKLIEELKRSILDEAEAMLNDRLAPIEERLLSLATDPDQNDPISTPWLPEPITANSEASPRESETEMERTSIAGTPLVTPAPAQPETSKKKKKKRKKSKATSSATATFPDKQNVSNYRYRRTSYHISASGIRRIGPVDHELAREAAILQRWFLPDSTVPEEDEVVEACPVPVCDGPLPMEDRRPRQGQRDQPHWWSQEIAALRVEANAARRAYTRSRRRRRGRNGVPEEQEDQLCTAYREKKAALQQAIANAKLSENKLKSPGESL